MVLRPCLHSLFRFCSSRIREPCGQQSTLRCDRLITTKVWPPASCLTATEHNLNRNGYFRSTKSRNETNLNELWLKFLSLWLWSTKSWKESTPSYLLP